MIKIFMSILLVALAACSGHAEAQTQAPPAADVPHAGYDAALATKLGGNDMGMRSYVLVILHTGPKAAPKGDARDTMFQGHFANMKRLADAGTLVLAGPLDGVDGWRGLFVLAVDSIQAAKAAVATDPVVIQGEMVPEFHTYFGSAGLMMINDVHSRISKKEI